MKKLNISAAAGSCPAARIGESGNYYFDGFFLDGSQTAYPSAVNSAAPKEINLFAVCSGDEVASYYAMEYLEKYNDRLYAEDEPDWDFILKNYLVNANRIIRDENENAGKDYSVRTTAFGFDDEYLYAAGVGDCALYLLRENDLIELTRDFDKKAALGESETASICAAEKVKLQSGDRVLAITYDAARAIGPDEIRRMMKADGDINGRVNKIIKAALDAGVVSAVSAVLTRVDAVNAGTFAGGKGGARAIAAVAIALAAVLAAAAGLYFALNSGVLT